MHCLTLVLRAFDAAVKQARGSFLAGLAALAAAAGTEAQGPQPEEQRLVSATTAGRASNGESTAAAISSGGELVVFESTATDLSPVDGKPDPSIYLFSATTGDVELISFAAENGPVVRQINADGPCRLPSVSADGELIVFSGEATNLVERDINGAVSDIFLHHRRTGLNTLVSAGPGGRAADDASDRPVISADGSVVVFQSLAANLAGAAAPSEVWRIYVYDVARPRLTRIDPPGAVASAHCRNPQVSADGGRIVFESAADNLVPGDANGRSDVFLFDRATGRIRLISTNSVGRSANADSFNPRISLDGRLVAFNSNAFDIVGGDANKEIDVFLHDIATGRTRRVSLSQGGGELRGPSVLSGINEDGRFVAFTSAFAISPIDDNARGDVHLRDTIYERTILVSALPGGQAAGSNTSGGGVLSADGQRIAFQSLATNFSRFDTTARSDIYLALVPQADLGPFPPSNHILLNVRGDVRQYSLDLAFQDRTVQFRGLAVRAFAVDEYNALWVLGDSAMARFEANSLRGVPLDTPFLESIKITGSPIHGMVAGGGYAWAAIGAQIFRFSADEESRSVRVSRGEAATAISLALDSLGSLWASVLEDDRPMLLRFDRDLRQLAAYPGDPRAPFLAIAASPDGALVARAPNALLKISRHGAELWRRPIKGGGGVAVDGDGSAYTAGVESILGFRADGGLFLELDNKQGFGARGGSVLVAVDGRGDVHVGESGLPAVARFTPSLPRKEPELFAVGATLSDHHGSDPTGFPAANVHAPNADSDDDGFLNRVETRQHVNPFDPRSPSRARRLPPVLELTATPIGGRQVLLEWLSSVPFTQYYVYRDRKPLPGSPFPAAAALRGIVDREVPSGVHVYRVVGQGVAGGGGGGGIDPGDQIAEPFSYSQEAVVSQGDGTVIASAPSPSPPDAVAYDSTTQSIYAALAGGTLWRLSTDLELGEAVALEPQNPLAQHEIRGMAVDSQAAGAPLYLLLGDGRVYRRSGPGPAALQVTLNGNGLPLAQGFSGLVITSGNDNDLFTTMAGPGVDCLIGFFRNNGGFKDEKSVSSLVGTPVEYALGASGTGSGGSVLAGLGVDLNGGAPAINRVVKLDLGADFALKDSGASVSLGALGSDDVSGFDFIPGKGLVVADRALSRIAIVEASFAGSLEILEVTPPRGRWDGQVANLQIKGTGFGANAGDLQVKFDGLDVPVKSLAGGVITVDAPAIYEAREVTVEVASATASDYHFPGFTYGFQRGDANNDGMLALSDAVFILTFLFSGGEDPPCPDAADSDDHENIQLTDAVYILNFLFLGTVPEPPPPFDALGIDPDGDLLPCAE